MENIEKCESYCMRHGGCICLIGIPEDGRKAKGAEAAFEEINSQTLSKYDARHRL